MILYKYISAERIDILENSSIRFTQYFNQNDPYECSFALLPLEREKEQAIEDDYAAEKAELEVQFRKRYFQFGMLCLTKNPKNILMWSHYADNHRGMVLGFDTNHTFFNSEEVIRDFHNQLEDKIPIQGFGTVKAIEYLKSRKQVAYGDEYSLYDILFTKSHHWEYEKEYRILKNIFNVTPAREFDSGEKIYLLEFPKECLKEVIFGLNVDESLKTKVKRISKSEYYSDIILQQAKLKHLDFGIELEPVKIT